MLIPRFPRHLEYFKLIPVKPVEPVFCPKPHKAILILDTTVNCILRKAFLNVIFLEIIWLASYHASNWQNK